MEGLVCVCVLVQSADVEVGADVFGSLDHGLHAVGCLLDSEDLVVEGLVEAVAACGHALGANCDADVDAACGDLVRDVLDGL